MPLQVPNAIRARREAVRFHGRRITQVRVARAIKTDRERVSQMEAGYMLANARELRVLAELFECNVRDLYEPHWISAIEREEAHATTRSEARAEAKA